ncbi:MAG: 2-amino-4-hydroxy-6-hydroxymethyldihydropteridine diphosphokinase [Candidatus Scalindua sp. AMX11]|nr:MAG: 2-amino-4-hydroxy-6-hydroxymethyldihydropteridine diphosphokinase [Candidatus Scalindua sp.]TDE64108.1 MAG: 2-amino-4-hydroxy-6-hydroxymethyldihydropteridine diphosphokinase [Candidatus Scalindua sp. AMX11]
MHIRYPEDIGYRINNSHRITMNAYVSVGSNIHPEDNIKSALTMLRRQVTITGISTFYRTKPLLGRRQADYLNGVWQIQVSMTAQDLTFKILKQIEMDLHRIKTADRYTSRTIDLDLLLYGDHILKDRDITIPNQDIYTRPFIAFPLFELDPNLTLPDTNTPISILLNSLSKEDLRPDIRFTEQLRNKVYRCQS